MTVIDVCDSGSRDRTDFVDHTAIEWQRVKRTHFVCDQRFHYAYPGPIRDLRHHLVVIPAERYGDQRLREHRLSVTPAAAHARVREDEFGNRVFEFDVREVDGEIAFAVSATVERTARPGRVRVARDAAERFLLPTELTACDERIGDAARELAGAARDDLELAELVHEWVAGALAYRSGVTAVHTTAADALALGHGLCQDYAHLMIAVCRAGGLPARYVSGHMPGEGGSHAWVEVLLASEDGGDLHAAAFDPTNRRRPNLGYATVAVGRDYRDVPPTSGTFTAPYGGQLSFTKRAGLTLVEMEDGEILRAV
jgi:transglutaminase-like putative cysteine protease